jgi:hypothetical protein
LILCCLQESYSNLSGLSRYEQIAERVTLRLLSNKSYPGVAPGGGKAEAAPFLFCCGDHRTSVTGNELRLRVRGYSFGSASITLELNTDRNATP